MTSTIGMATNKKIIELLSDYRSELLILKPRFQRNLVWNTGHKCAFIETIIRKLPFPEVYFSDGELDLVNQKTTIWVVDGQQRLSTIFDYINNEIDLKKQRLKLFSDLSDEEQTEFFNYVVVVRSLGKLTDQETKEIFHRINSVGYALNSVEINNALYEGEFISVAKNISQHALFKNLEILNDQEISRMKDVEYILLVLASVELGIYFTQNSELEGIIVRFDDEYPQRNEMNEVVLEVLELIYILNFDFDSLWFKKTSMFSLIVELAKYIRSNGKKSPNPNNLKNALVALENAIVSAKGENPDTNKYAKFYKHMFQQTTSKTGRIARGLVIAEVLATL